MIFTSRFLTGLLLMYLCKISVTRDLWSKTWSAWSFDSFTWSCNSSITLLVIRHQTKLILWYSGGQNIVDTLFMFYLHALTLGENNFWSVKIVVLYLVCNWRLKCFLSISVIEYPISLLLVLWGWILSASKSTPTQEFISKKSPPNLSSVLADCSCRDLKKSSSWGQKWGYWIFHGWNRLKTFQSSNTYQIQHHNFYRSKIISTQS